MKKPDVGLHDRRISMVIGMRLGMFGFNTALKNKKYTINTFTNVNYQNNVAFLYNQDTKNNDRNTSTGLTLGERVQVPIAMIGLNFL